MGQLCNLQLKKVRRKGHLLPFKVLNGSGFIVSRRVTFPGGTTDEQGRAEEKKMKWFDGFK